MNEGLTWPTNAVHVPSANHTIKSYRKIRIVLLEAAHAADQPEEQQVRVLLVVPPVVPLDISLASSALLLRLSLCLFLFLSCSLSIDWLRSN